MATGNLFKKNIYIYIQARGGTNKENAGVGAQAVGTKRRAPLAPTVTTGPPPKNARAARGATPSASGAPSATTGAPSASLASAFGGGGEELRLGYQQEKNKTKRTRSLSPNEV